MDRRFGNIPQPNPHAASEIADAARHVESLLQGNNHEHDLLTDSDRFPLPGVDIPNIGEAEEVLEEVDTPVEPVHERSDDETYDGAVGGVVDCGIEYLAFYKSFRDVTRAPAPGRWGIFFIRKRCFALATDMSFSTGESFSQCLDVLAAFLYSHELYHYRFDAHCLQMEASGGQPVYRPYRRLVASRPINEWHEESVANFYALKSLQQSKNIAYPASICDYLWDLVWHSPGAYAGGVDKRQSQRKDQMAKQATAAFGNNGPSVWHGLLESVVRMGTNLSIPREPTISGHLHLNNCPVYWIDWVKGGQSVLVPQAVSCAEIGGDFIKRYLSGVLDHKSDHSYYRIDNGERIKLPNPHKTDLKNNEFYNIIGKAGMTSRKFHDERARTSVWKKGVPRMPVLPPRIGPHDKSR
ncbi:hypothetical protein [Hydrogenophaga defluvii]|uniref:Uncharacterized protein n=1 Tax=Hydrogenophaga defluvii TaxID=249410 RepID=A0ABW2S6L7_9BURK